MGPLLGGSSSRVGEDYTGEGAPFHTVKGATRPCRRSKAKVARSCLRSYIFRKLTPSNSLFPDSLPAFGPRGRRTQLVGWKKTGVRDDGVNEALRKVSDPFASAQKSADAYKFLVGVSWTGGCSIRISPHDVSHGQAQRMLPSNYLERRAAQNTPS